MMIRSCSARVGFCRTLAFSAARQNSAILPSDPNMKSEAWAANGSDDLSITRKVVGMAKNLQDSSKPPINVHKSLLRYFGAGQTYDPFDFSMNRLDMEAKWDKKRRDVAGRYNKGEDDIFVKSGVNPLDLYAMPEILSRFISQTGQILPREVTGCNAANQKKLGIAIKRARAAGLLSTTHRHARYMPKRLL